MGEDGVLLNSYNILSIAQRSLNDQVVQPGEARELAKLRNTSFQGSLNLKKSKELTNHLEERLMEEYIILN